VAGGGFFELFEEKDGRGGGAEDEEEEAEPVEGGAGFGGGPPPPASPLKETQKDDKLLPGEILAQETLTKLDGVTFDRLLSQNNPFNGGSRVFDLNGVTFIAPAGLVQLAAACMKLSQDGERPTVIVSDGAVRGYLSRCGWFGAVREIAEIRPIGFDVQLDLSKRFRGSNPLLLEVTELRCGAHLPALLDKIVGVFRDRLKYNKYDAFDVATAVSEMSQNTFDHNEAGCGFLAMQGYGEGRKRFVEIAIADCGDGLRKTLRRNPKYTGLSADSDAIKLSIQLGVSQHTDPTRGTGLHHLLEIAYKHSGSIQIRSGNASARYRMDRKQGWLRPVPTMPGVQIVFTLHSKEAA
jgi:hypothetical protein